MRYDASRWRRSAQEGDAAMTIVGTDCSDFDWARGPMDISSMARDGIAFLTHKATEGTKVQHVHYGEALRRATQAGIDLVGAYVVPRTPGNNGHGSVVQQVTYLLNYVDAQTPWWRQWPGFFFQVDTEHWGYDDVSPAIGAQMCAELKARTGRFVIHYAPRWAYDNTIGGDDPLWASSYGTNPAVPYRDAYPGDASSGWAPYSGRTPTFLQYGSKLTIGSQPTCDGNAFRGTLDELRALITGGTMAGEIADKALAALDGRNALGEAYLRLAEGRSDNDPKYSNEFNLKKLHAKADNLAMALGNVQAGSAPTQAQVDAAIEKAMLNPAVQAGIGDAIASHLKVS
jgi:GH25 family lysozyme M1 (1,4-beta-N-acetylmuramidase)